MATPELQSGSIPSTPLASTATAANSTTLAQLEAATRRNRLIITVLVTFATVALSLTAFAPWNLLAAAVLFLAAVITAYATNSLSPEQLDKLVGQLGDAGERAASELSKKKGGTP